MLQALGAGAFAARAAAELRAAGLVSALRDGGPQD